MAQVTARAIVWNTTAGAKTTASITPANGELLVAVVGVAGTDTAPTMSDSKGGAWTLVDSFRSHGSAITGGLRMYVRNSAADGTAMTVTMTPSGDTGGGVAVLSVTDPAAFGASAVRSNGGQADQAAGTPAPVLSNTPRSYNPVIVGVMTQSNGSANCAPRTATTPDYTEDYDQGFNTPASGIEVQHIDAGETAATLTLGAATPSGFASIGIEIHTTQRVTLTPATETDAAQVLDVDKPILTTLTAASETDAAEALTATKPIQKTVAPTLETDTAQALSVEQAAGGQRVTLTPATETDAAQPLSSTKPIRKTLTPAAESDLALALSVTKTIFKALAPASEADLAVALAFTKPIHKTLAAALEADTAVALSVSQPGAPIFKTLTPATEVDLALALAASKPIHTTLTPASELDAAAPLVVIKPIRVVLVPALEMDVAVALVLAGDVLPDPNPIVLVGSERATLRIRARGRLVQFSGFVLSGRAAEALSQWEL